MMLERDRPESCLSDLRLDRILLGELARSPHLDACAACRARLAALEADRRVFAARAPRRRLVPTMLAAAAVIAIAAAIPRSEPTTRTKGTPYVTYYVAHAGRMHEGGAREDVFAGDAIQIASTSDAPRFLAIISIDERGQGSIYVPQAAVAAGRDRLLPESTVLDGAPGTETLYAVFCDQPTPITATLVAPPGCTLEAFAHLAKRGPP